MKPIELDGRTGEGGGQLVRLAVGLAALTSQPVTITNVRGNRQGGRGGGLKSQHVTSIAWLASVTDAQTTGLSVGSKTLTFIPRRSPLQLASEGGKRKYSISAESDAASALLVLQAIFPYILFASAEGDEPLELDISGGTNVAWSLSYEYFDQVLMPTLEERFGVQVERELRQRGWSLGSKSRGNIWQRIHPVPQGQKLRYVPPPAYTYPDSYRVERVDVSIIVPQWAHEMLQSNVVRDLGTLFPDADVHFKLLEDSRDDARWSVLLVAQSTAGIRWARDVLWSMPKKAKSRDVLVSQLSRALCKRLYEEVELGGTVDEHLQDQVVSLQALAEGPSSFPRHDDGHGADERYVDKVIDGVASLSVGAKLRKEKTHAPFGHGSGHTQTARWVISELLPKSEFYNKGDVVRGVGFSL
ncbi:RNA 3'-terminal phosphate cyclase [Purpureocillium lilacinum]|uniref:RNA 3'-terminal phosphate cyclase n=1 Tax=Purpureocillium lilacinum TaxID=33203 RepID=A0A179HI64_PURLI|nr:RNA 3'-terminal phosphate cyclase [Purpureocillium lilacinum]OAQ89724.1 RNA 3'-terminal phosphate cyclase [Purpureocillium lilacinum]